MNKQNANPICPECGSDKVLQIFYGYVDAASCHDIDFSKYHLGGCCDLGLKWHCDDCEWEF